MSGGTGQGRLPEKHLITDTVIDESVDDEAEEARGEEGTGRGGVGAAVSVVGGSRGVGGGGGDGVGRGSGVGGSGGNGVGRGSGGVGGGGGDGVGREGGVEGATIRGTVRRVENECFDFDIALLCGDEEEIANELLTEMQTVKLDNNRPLRVIDYYHSTFGGSIIETPRNVLRRCRFVFVLIKENAEEGGELRYARNELVALVKVNKQNQHRFDCVRPLLREKGDHAEMEMPSGLEDAVKVYWPRDNRERSEAKLVQLIQESIDKDKMASMKQSSVVSLFTGPWSEGVPVYSGQYNSLTKLHMPVQYAELLISAAKSVGMISKNIGTSSQTFGTGFRIGSKFIITASHVIKNSLDLDVYQPFNLTDIQEKLDGADVHIHFKTNMDLKVSLKKIVFFNDCIATDMGNNLDVTIAEVAPGCELPDHLQNFYDDCEDIDAQMNLYFLGHNGGSDFQDIGFSLSVANESRVNEVISKLEKSGYSDRLHNPLPFQRVGKAPWVHLQGPFRHGASGSAGMVLSNGMVKVYTILTGGYFDDLENELQIQEGTRMRYLKEVIEQENGDLCEDIFGEWQSTRRVESPMEF